jgi:hypothetical protein
MTVSVTVEGVSGFTVMLRAFEAVPPPVTWTVKLDVTGDVPTAVGVPPITPVEAFRFSPAGRLPAVTDQLYGVVPPVAASV